MYWLLSYTQKYAPTHARIRLHARTQHMHTRARTQACKCTHASRNKPNSYLENGYVKHLHPLLFRLSLIVIFRHKQNHHWKLGWRRCTLSHEIDTRSGIAALSLLSGDFSPQTNHHWNGVKGGRHFLMLFFTCQRTCRFWTNSWNRIATPCGSFTISSWYEYFIHILTHLWVCVEWT